MVKDGSERHPQTEAGVMLESDGTRVQSGEEVVHPARLERAACGFEVRRSIQLSYGCACCNGLILQCVRWGLQLPLGEHLTWLCPRPDQGRLY